MSEPHSTTEPLVRARALGKRVPSPEGDLDILDDVNLSVAPGETLAIVGESGSGKTTLLGLLAGLDLPTHGGVTLAGEDLNALDEDARARLRGRMVGFVFQSFHLLPGLTAEENVMLPMELMGREDSTAEARALLERVGLGHRLHHTPRQLSGGEQQRVALARAFAGTPRVLFADEPTGNLDRRTGVQVSDLLFDLNSAHGTTLVLVTHDPALAERCAHRLTLEAGRVAARTSRAA